MVAGMDYGNTKSLKFKKGDIVWHYVRPGDLRGFTITEVSEDGNCLLSKHDQWVHITDLFSTLEEAQEGLSPAGKRYAECLREARIIVFDHFEGHGLCGTENRHDLERRIADKLFDMED